MDEMDGIAQESEQDDTCCKIDGGYAIPCEETDVSSSAAVVSPQQSQQIQQPQQTQLPQPQQMQHEHGDGTVVHFRTVVDDVYRADSVKRQSTSLRKTLDSAYLADAVSRQANHYRKVTDSVFLADLVTVLKTGAHLVHIIDSLYLGDTVSRQVTALRKVLDDVYLGDLLKVFKTAPVRVSDSAFLADLVKRQASVSRQAQDNAYLGDAVKRQATSLRKLLDSVYLADQVNRRVTAYRLMRDLVYLGDLAHASLPTVMAAVIYIIRAHYTANPGIIAAHYSANPGIIAAHYSAVPEILEASAMYPIQENRRVPRGSGIEAWNLTLNPPPISGGYSGWTVVYQVLDPTNNNAEVFQQTLTLIDSINGVWQQTFTSAQTATTGPMPLPTYNEFFWRTDQSPNSLLLRFGQLQFYGVEFQS